MPSDPRVTRALAILAGPIEKYRAALAATLEEVRGHLDAGRSGAESRALRLRQQLGEFAGSRIDAARMSAILGDKDALPPASLQRLERASDTLRNLVSRGDSLFHVEVPRGGDVAPCVRRQLALVGRAFAAARIAAAARAGSPSGLDEETALDAFAFADWSASERRLGPPLIVSLDGADLVAGALTPFIDGGQKILLVVEGLCAPAPLVRLVTPGTLVVQAHELEDLEVLTQWPGTAVGALMPSWAAAFVHDPSAGPESWQRMSVHLSRDWRIKRVGGFTPEQQQEELKQLQLLAAAPSLAAPAARAAEPAGQGPDPADRLAAWLLQQAQLTGPLARD